LTQIPALPLGFNIIKYSIRESEEIIFKNSSINSLPYNECDYTIIAKALNPDKIIKIFNALCLERQVILSDYFYKRKDIKFNTCM